MKGGLERGNMIQPMQAAPSASCVVVVVHPLVLVNISDHVMRHRVQNLTGPVLGVLLGSYSGRKLSIHTSFELANNKENSENDSPLLDIDFLSLRLSQYLAIFPNYELVGCYQEKQGDPSEDSIRLLRQIEGLNENPYLLLLREESSSRAVSLDIYERQLVTIDGSLRPVLQKTAHQFEQSDAERISVEHIDKMNLECVAHSEYAAHLSNLLISMRTLHARLDAVSAYVEAVKGDRIPWDHQRMRDLFSACKALRSQPDESSGPQLQKIFEDTSLVTLLSMTTKTTAQLQQIVDRCQLTYERKGKASSRGFSNNY